MGLWHDKYFDRWTDAWALKAPKGESNEGSSLKTAWLRTVATTPTGNKTFLAEATNRILRLQAAKNGTFAVFRTESRFVTGIGRSHPVENGFAWHPVLGVPYLPGSSVKGLVRAWARLPTETGDGTVKTVATEARLNELFGTPNQAGQFDFLDAIPMAPVKLDVDVLTPHFANWTPASPPGDWKSPAPVPFLTVARETPFLFSIIPSRMEPAVITKWIPIVGQWLQSALQELGAGAKTAVGYGRFSRDEVETKRLVEQATRARLEETPEGRWQLRLASKSDTDVYQLAQRHLKSDPLSDLGERRALARAIVKTGMPGHWRKGAGRDGRMNIGKDKLKDVAALIERLADDGPGGERG